MSWVVVTAVLLVVLAMFFANGGGPSVAQRREAMRKAGKKVAEFIPGAKPIIGHFVPLQKDQRSFWFESLKMSGGKPFYWQVGPMQLFTNPDPDFGKIFFKADEEFLDFNEAIIHIGALDFTFGRELLKTEHHVKAIRGKFNPNLHKFSSLVHKGAERIIFDLLGNKPGQSKVLDPVFDNLMAIVAACTSSAILGPSALDVPEIQNVFKNLHYSVAGVLKVTKFLPNWLSHVYSYFMFKPTIKMMERYLDIYLAKRREELRTRRGDDESEYFMDYLIEEQDNDKFSNNLMANYLGSLIFAAMSTTSNALRLILVDTAIRPELQQQLREEQFALIKEHGHEFTRPVLDNMRKLESAIKESLRIGSRSLWLVRSAKYDSEIEGYFVPKGEIITFSGFAIHYDPARYPSPHEYKPDRFLNSTQFATTDFVAWGGGKHACPGRFFSMQELKIIMGTILRNYEFRTADGKEPKMVFDVNGAKREEKPLLFTHL